MTKPSRFVKSICRFGLAGMLLFLGDANLLFSQTFSSDLPQKINSVAAIRRLTAAQADRHLPVHLRGVLTFFDGNLYSCFFQDGTAGIYLVYDQLKQSPVLRTGQQVEIEGVTSQGEFAPVIRLDKIKVIGEGTFPAAKLVSYEELASGREDSQLIQISGVVRAVVFDGQEKYYHLKIATGGGFLTALTLSLPVTNADNLVDCQVTLRGVCTSLFNVRRQLYGLRLLVPRVEDLQINVPVAADPFAQPARPIEQLMQFLPQDSRGSRVKVIGTVTYRRGDDRLYIQDQKEGLLIETAQSGPLLPGDKVEVLGFPARGDYTPKLEDAEFRKIGSGDVPLPVNITADDALKGPYDSRLVRVEGTVLDRTRYGDEQFLVLQSGGFIFNAYLEHKTGGVNFSYLPNGSKVAVTGVCVIDPGNNWHVGADWRAKSFRVLMRFPGDIYLLARPPWWTLQRLIWAVGILLAGVLLALAWVFILRRRVGKQTAIIRRQLQTEAALKERYEELFENANDMVFTHDLAGRITSINQIGEIWFGQKREIIIAKNVAEFMVEDQRAAMRQWLESLSQKSDSSPTEWDFVGAAGKKLRLEISARLIRQPGKNPEVESVARDITERKQLEREILQISNREQRRIGHDLHDGVCQQLAAIAYRLDMVSDELKEKNLPEFSEMERIGGLLNEAISQTRGVARGLFPVRLEEDGLVSALEEIVVNATKLFNARCKFTCVEPPPKPDVTVSLHLFYITQEAVLNAAKHGQATEILIAISRPAERFVLTVSDNGRGFEPSERHGGGMGIRIMRYRAQVIDATLDLKSCPGRGTQITCAFRAPS